MITYSSVTPHDWDARSYDRVAAGVKALGHEVLDRLELRGDEAVLDAGCGPGEITEALVARLPAGRVIAVDASPSMAAAARERLGDRAEVNCMDLLDLALDDTVDAVLSTATFHWIADHDRLFERLRGAMRPGARLVAQCGGAGNVEDYRAAVETAAHEHPYAQHLAGWAGPWRFAPPAETEAALRRAGFSQARCWPTERTIEPDDPGEYSRTVMLGEHLDRLPSGLHDGFVAAVLERLPTPLRIHYLRLDIDATA